MRTFAMALAIFTLALNARANIVTWSYTGNFNYIVFEEPDGVKKFLENPNIVQITAYIIWDYYDAPPLGNKEIIIEQLKDGSFNLNGTAKQIAGVEVINPAEVSDEHETDLVNLEENIDYILDVVFLLQFEHDVVPGYKYLWFDPMHDEYYHGGDKDLTFYVGDFQSTKLFKPIPEPATGLLAALGGFVLLLRRKRG